MSWRASAACAGVDNPDLFFPDPVNPSRKAVSKAKELCGACPVWMQCRDMAMYAERGVIDPKLRQGIFGGLTPQERVLLEDGGAA